MNFSLLTVKLTSRCLQILLLVCLFNPAVAQSLLNKAVSINVRQKPLTDILHEIGDKGGLYFSYDGRLIAKDSLVTLVADNKPVASLLYQLFQDKYQYEERKNYIIITPAFPGLSVINPDLETEQNYYAITGTIINAKTGEHLANASVYEKQQLAATLTNEQGNFRLKFKINNREPVELTVSKRFYRDTAIRFLQPVMVNSLALKRTGSVSGHKGNRVERVGLGEVFISTRQMIQSLNIPDFFAHRPFQVSLTPGLSTHGMFSSQVVNKFSVNVVGGYTAGINGFEIGGLFNIDKGDSRYLQLAGIFNLVGGNLTGVQLAGIHNRALDTVKGAQLALFANDAGEQITGIQFSAINNTVHRLKGVQIGLVNKADTSEGISIGLLNIIGNGFYQVTYSVNDISNTNFSLKTGTHAFYSELLTSVNVSPKNKFYAVGFGLGHDFMFNNNFYLSVGANYRLANTGVWDDRWAQGKLLLNLQLSKSITIVAGPTFNHYSHSNSINEAGYENVTHVYTEPTGYNDFTQTRSWVGWEAGVTLNGVFKPVNKTVDNSQSWYLDFAGTAGIGWDQPYGLVTGGELFVQRDLGGHITGTLSTGYTHFSVENHYGIGNLGNGDIYAQPINIIPVKAGIRLRPGGKFFVASEVGEAFGHAPVYSFINSNNTQFISAPFHTFMYSISLGLSFKSGLETGIKFEDYALQSQYKQFALRLGYRFKFGQ